MKTERLILSPVGGLVAALRLTESNLTSLIDAKHENAVLMTEWREAVRAALRAHP